jgi:mannitol-1-/sugar-/sorbitol-6-phosphatase
MMELGSPIPCDAVLFDCDGVLVESDEAVDLAWARWAEYFGLDGELVLPVVHGRRAADTVAALLPANAQPEGLARIYRYELEATAEVWAIPGALELVATVPPGRWAIVTSGTKTLATARLAAAGFGAPDVLVAAEDVARGKPFPDGYLLGARLLSQSIGTCVVFEDSEAGLAAAHAAGVAGVIGVGPRAAKAEVDLVIPDLRYVRFRAAGGSLELVSDSRPGPVRPSWALPPGDGARPTAPE